MIGFFIFLVVFGPIVLLLRMAGRKDREYKEQVKANRYLAGKYDKEREQKKEENIKKSENNKLNIDDEEVKKVFKELKKNKDIEEVAKKLDIKKSRVYEIKLFLEDEGLL